MARLPAEELTSLLELSGSVIRKHVISSHRHRKLIRRGFASVYHGTPAIATMDQAKLLLEITRANRFPFPV